MTKKTIVALAALSVMALISSRVSVYDCSEMTSEVACSHRGTLLIERIDGEVTTENMDGRVLNASNPAYDYINYKGVDANKGDIIRTYCVYNPMTIGEDDILLRIDFVKECNK